MTILEFMQMQEKVKAFSEKILRSQQGEKVQLDAEESEVFETSGGVLIPDDEKNPFEYARLVIHKREASERNPAIDFSECKTIKEILDLEKK